MLGGGFQPANSFWSAGWDAGALEIALGHPVLRFRDPGLSGARQQWKRFRCSPIIAQILRPSQGGCRRPAAEKLTHYAHRHTLVLWLAQSLMSDRDHHANQVAKDRTLADFDVGGHGHTGYQVETIRHVVKRDPIDGN